MLTQLDCRSALFKASSGAQRLEIKLQGLEVLSDRSLLATVHFEGTIWSSVGARNRRIRDIQVLEKIVSDRIPAIELDFSGFNMGGFYGLSRVMLERVEQDGDLLRSEVSMRIFSALQIIVPRSRILRVIVNRVDQGNFRLSELPDSTMMERYFGRTLDGTGTLVSTFEAALSGLELKDIHVNQRYLSNYILATLLAGDGNGYFNQDNSQTNAWLYQRSDGSWPVPRKFLMPFHEQCGWEDALSRGVYSNLTGSNGIQNALALVQRMDTPSRESLVASARELADSKKSNALFEMAAADAVAGMGASPLNEATLSEMRIKWACGVRLLRLLADRNFNPRYSVFEDSYNKDMDKIPSRSRTSPAPVTLTGSDTTL